MAKPRKNILNVEDRKDENGLWLSDYYITTPEVYLRHHTRSGILWRGMFFRTKSLESYSESNVLFEGYQEFAEWCNEQPEYRLLDAEGKVYHLDKDLLEPHNQDYAPDLCCFIPRKLNSIFTDRSASCGVWPLGVNFSKKNGRFHVREAGKHVGYFDDPLEAHKAWQYSRIKSLQEMMGQYDFLSEKILIGIDKHVKLIEADLKRGNVTTKL